MKNTYGLNQVQLAAGCINEKGDLKDNIHKAFIRHLLPLSNKVELYFNKNEKQMKLYNEIIREICKYEGQVKVCDDTLNNINFKLLTPSWDASEFIAKLSNEELDNIGTKIKTLNLLNHEIIHEL